MLAYDIGEAREILEENLREHTLMQLYDSVVIPALSMAQRDKQQNYVDDTVAESISEGTRELVEELNEEYPKTESAWPALSSSPNAKTILCLPARTATDETIAMMLSQLLEREGMTPLCFALRPHEEAIRELLEDTPAVIVISALQPYGLQYARKIVAQVRTRMPQVAIVVGLWNYDRSIDKVSARFGMGPNNLFATTLTEAVDGIRGLFATGTGATDREDAVPASLRAV
jgi:methylmalonyl-CoA mutase cobalamin-binding subunit